jgi:hypothetical protein
MKHEIVKQHEEFTGKLTKLARAEIRGYPGKVLNKSEPED